MVDVIGWMEAHEKLAGWAQAIGALVAILAAFLVAHLQARYALKHDDRRTAERVRSLARLFLYWRDICKRSCGIRKREGQRPDIYALNQSLFEFNHTASEINKFSFVDAPSESVLRVMIRYREMCAPLSNHMNPEYKPPLPADELEIFSTLIDELERQVEVLMAEADRLGR